MLFGKISLRLFIFTSLIFFISCKADKNPAKETLVDPVRIISLKQHYDSLYKNYRSSKNRNTLIQAGLFADSLLQYNYTLLNDTGLLSKYLDVLFYRAVNLNDLNYFVTSASLFTKYISIQNKSGAQIQKKIAYAQKSLGNIYSRFGDYKKAELLLQQSLNYYNTIKDTVEISSCTINLSIPLKELRQYKEASEKLRQLLSLPTAAAKRKAYACTELADIEVRRQNIAAAALQIQQAQQLLAHIPNDNSITSIYADLFNIEGDIEMANKHPQQAFVYYQQSLDSAKKSSAQHVRSREIGKIYIAMGKALEQLNLSDSALSYYTKALYTVTDVDTLNKFSLPQTKDIYAENTIAEALYARADCIIKTNMQDTPALQNAVRCYQLAFATERKLLNAFSYDESRLYMVEQTRQQTEKAIAVCYLLYKKTNDVHWANTAFLFAEHNKAFVLEESIRRNTAAALFLQDDSSYKKMQELQSTLALAEIELGKQHFSANPDSTLLQSLTASQQKAEEELLAVENNIRVKNPQYTDWLNEETTLTAEEIINKTIVNNTGMVEYFNGDSSLYAFSTVKNKPLAFYKLADSIKDITTDFLHFFSTQNLILNNPAQYATVAHTLYRSLLGPCLPADCSSLLIIPDGFINYIPFDALLTTRTSSTNIVSFPFLITQQEIFYAFSCKTLIAQSQIKNSNEVNSLVAFAPVFAGKERGLASLAHSNEELDAIKQWYPNGKFFSGNSATVKQFDENCSKPAIIHLATHASPGNDTLPARIELYDSAMYTNSIYAKKIPAQLVVLSGCETGTGLLNKSEGLMSLARGFSYAGTKNVIASLWQTEDNSSATIFKNFYRNLSSTHFSSALRHAKLDFMKSGAVTSASPYYWSGYIYIGSPEEMIPSTHNKTKWLAAVTSLFLIAVYFIFLRRRRLKLVA